MKATKLLILIVLSSFYTSIFAQVLVIDDFSDSHPLLFSVGSGSSTAGFNAGLMLGGERDLDVSVSVGSIASIEVTTGVLNFGLTAGTTGNGFITWDGADGLPSSTDIDFTGLGGIDLTNAGTLDGINITIDSTDVVGSIVLTVYTDGANSSSFTLALPSGIAAATQFFLPFTSFSVNSGTGADFSNVGAITMDVSGSDLDALISLIQAESSLTATMTDALFVDNDFDVVASPGDTIRYTVVVNNPDDGANFLTSGVNFGLSVDPNSSLVVGSVTSSQGTVAAGNSPGDTSISVNIGSIADSSSVTVTFDAVINSSLGSSITQISTLGLVTSDDLVSGIFTDDTAVGGMTDPTITPIVKTVLGDFIWDDLNGNGVQDGGSEIGIAGVTLDAYADIDSSGSVSGGDILLSSTVTNGSGNYAFGLPNYVNFVIDLTDSANILNGFAITGGTNPAAVLTAAGSTDNSIDFGYNFANGSIGDFVWNDLNGDGIQDAGELGIDAVTLDLYVDMNGNGMIDGGEPVISTQATSGGGAFDFTGLSAGDYIVDLTDTGFVVFGYTLTAGSNPLVVTLISDQDFDEADFGFQQQNATIGDFIWNDLNGDGVQDGGELGIDGVTLDLYRDNDSNGIVNGGDAFLGTQTTGGGGSYDFTNLSGGDYIVDLTDTGFVLSGFASTTGSSSVSITLSGGQDFDAADFGFQQQNASIGDFVWNDLNGNGIQDTGEPGIDGVTLDLYIDNDSNGLVSGADTFLGTHSTAGGAYDFTNLNASDYVVDLIDSGSILSGFTLTTGSSSLAVTLVAGEDFDGADFGYQQQDASIGDFVWNDLNGDGIQDVGEVGLSGITVYLDSNNNGSLDGGEPSVVTDGSGAYDFTGLALGNYNVEVELSSLPAGFSLTTANTPLAVSLSVGEDYNNADFGFQTAIEISISDISQNEGDTGVTVFTISVNLNHSSVAVVSVDYITAAGSALTPSDFISTFGTLTFNPGDTSQTLDVSVIGDEVFEINQDFTVNLSNPTNASLIDNSGLATIVNDDPLPSISIDDQLLPEGPLGNFTTMSFTVSLSNPSEDPISVFYVTNEQTAVADIDFNTIAGTSTFAALEVNQTVEIQIIGDDIDESNEFFNVRLSSPTNATLLDSTGVGTIQDDDGVPTISINDIAHLEGDNVNSTIVMTVTASNASSSEITVNYETVKGSASSDIDFIASSGTITIPSKTLNTNFSVDIIGDYLIENDESFNVVLSSAVNASISDGTAVVTIQDDDEGADLSVTLVVDPVTAEVSDILTYTMQVTNNGPEEALETIASLNLFEKVQFLNASTTLGSCNHVNSLVSCQLGDLGNGQSTEVIIQARIIIAGNINAQANVSSSTSDDSDSSNNSALFGVVSSALKIPSLSFWGLIALMFFVLISYKNKIRLRQ